jgi:hypothetical protein
VACRAIANFVVGWIIHLTRSISGLYFMDSLESLQDCFHAPETPTSDNGFTHALQVYIYIGFKAFFFVLSLSHQKINN